MRGFDKPHTLFIYRLNEPDSFPTNFPKPSVVILQKEVVRWLDHVN
nr:MAG TPA: hypothetical protein [Caudoviricetes sp.]